MGRPDALMLPGSVKVGRRIGHRIRAVSAVAEPLLEVDYAGGERAIVRELRDGRLFVTRDPHDTILFPTAHQRAGQPRYRWVRPCSPQGQQQSDGTEIGYLVEEAAACQTT